MEKLNIDFIQKNLDTSFIGKNIIYFEELDSTNSFAVKVIKDKRSIEDINPLNGTIIIAETQTEGKGRFDRKWISPPGGLWFSIILQPETGLDIFSKITLLGAAVLVEIIADDYLSLEESRFLYVKWPNDIYYKDKKLAGILAESEKVDNKNYLIAGIGINVNCKIENELEGNGRSFKATSLKDILGVKIDRNFLLLKILTSFEKNYISFADTSDFKFIFKKIEKKLIL
ncbi:MAG: biotin--[acetyl-CoA-carboxylase] ligase [Actinobacteria bacterium]|nr:biotin--[acetyl-CoA-carboxylase] ligase [Actinomycetota bacterium]